MKCLPPTLLALLCWVFCMCTVVAFSPPLFLMRSRKAVNRRSPPAFHLLAHNTKEKVSVKHFVPQAEFPRAKTNDEGGNESEQDDAMSPELIGSGAVAAFATILAGLAMATNMNYSAGDLVGILQEAFNDPSAALEQVVDKVDSMGPLGALYFGVAYTIAEVLAIPAIPLTASAGYLFGPVEGTGVVLLSASIAASISFLVGRTLLRDYVENVLEEYPKFAKIDRAIGKEGFKLMLLLRLSPIFPFALSNYLYGASSINFNAFFWGTLFGFTPGTIAYVYTGYIGKALTGSSESAYPWYVYAVGLTIFAGFLKVIADTATQMVEELEDEEGDERL